MSERFGYLNDGQRRALQSYADPLRPLVEGNPVLSDADIVIEGAVGSGMMMAHIIRSIFPKALYVGTDLTEFRVGEFGRYRRNVRNEDVSRIKEANKNPEPDMLKACLFANCMDYDLIRDLLEKTMKSKPILVTHNGARALFAKELSYEDKKEDYDRYEMGRLFDQNTPYLAQLHLSTSVIWDGYERDDVYKSAFYYLEEIAKKVGWPAERYEGPRMQGLLIVSPKVTPTDKPQ